MIPTASAFDLGSIQNLYEFQANITLDEGYNPIPMSINAGAYTSTKAKVFNGSYSDENDRFLMHQDGYTLGSDWLYVIGIILQMMQD